MKVLYIASLSLALLLNGIQAYSQCTPNQSYTSPGLYPDQFPDGTVGQAYSEDITLVFFKDTTQSGITCTAQEFEIYGVAGLPPGITWQANTNNNKFYPQNNVYGCVNFSGTPTIAGTYKVIASGNMVLGGDALCPVDNPVTYEVPFVVHAASAVNSAFTISATSGCAPLTVNFATSNNLTGTYTYLWEFGDANNSASVVEDPTFTYTDPGTYVITQTATNIDPVDYILSSISIESLPTDAIWQPGLEIENPNWPLSGDNFPDVYIEMYDSQNKFLYGYDPNNSSSTTYLRDQTDPNALPVTFAPDPSYQYLNAETYTMKVYDLDPDGLWNDNDFLGQVSFFGQGPTATQTYSFGSDGKLKVTFTIYNTAVDPILVSDTIVVYPVPDVNVTTGALSFCEGDSVILTSDQSSGNQWYADSTLLFGYDSSAFVAKESGNYYVIVTNQYGCTDTSAIQTVTVNENPPKPNYWYYNDTLWTSLTGYDLQWYLDGVAISGADESYCPINASGSYTLIATSSFGCSTESSASVYTFIPPASIHEAQSIIQNMNLYPNPSNGQFTVSFEISKTQDLSIVVIDIVGNQILDIPLSQVNGNVNQNINISHLAKGLYYVAITINKQQIMKKIIIE